MTDERRKVDRVAIVLECSWAADARVTDLGSTGCYVDSGQVPSLGDDVEFTVAVAGDTLAVRGRVIHAKRGVGFAIVFDDGETSADRFRSFVERRTAIAHASRRTDS